MDSVNDKKILIADIGHWETKSSFAGDDAPRTLIHSLVGEPRFPQFIKSSESILVNPPSSVSDMYYIHPILENGKITSESRFQEFLSHLQNENKSLKSQDFGLFLSEPLFLDNKQKALIAKIVFEEHKNPFIGFYPQPLMALFSKGISNGLIVELGHGLTQIAAVQNSFRISDAFRRQDIGGGALNNFLERIIHTQGLPINQDFINNIVDFNDLKEQMVSCASLQQRKDLGQWDSRRLKFANSDPRKTCKLKLPDESTIEVPNMELTLGELLFDPNMNGLSMIGIQDLLYDSFQSLDVSLRKTFRENIYISGGTTQMTNFAERLTQEMNQKVFAKQMGYSFGNIRNFNDPKEVKSMPDDYSYFDIKSVGNPTHSVFIGGTVICNTASNSLFITSKEFEEMGQHGIFRKFY
jgi:actin-related protein